MMPPCLSCHSRRAAEILRDQDRAAFCFPSSGDIFRPRFACRRRHDPSPAARALRDPAFARAGRECPESCYSEHGPSVRTPVTFGGGMTIENGGFGECASALKSACSSQRAIPFRLDRLPVRKFLKVPPSRGIIRERARLQNAKAVRRRAGKLLATRWHRRLHCFARMRAMLRTISAITRRCFGLRAVRSASDWKVIRQQDRDYVTFANVAQFYQFPEYTRVSRAVSLRKRPPWHSRASRHERALHQRGAFLHRLPDSQPAATKTSSRAMDVSKIIDPIMRPHRIPNGKKVDTVVLDPGHGGTIRARQINGARKRRLRSMSRCRPANS